MKKGFSLIEVLVALAIGGLLLVSSTDLLVSISKQWIEGPSSKDAFDAHVNGVARFLTAAMEEATVPTLNSSGNQAVDLRRPVGFSDSEDPLIHFYLGTLLLSSFGPKAQLSGSMPILFRGRRRLEHRVVFGTSGTGEKRGGRDGPRG